jgi:hypothetical protein
MLSLYSGLDEFCLFVPRALRIGYTYNLSLICILGQLRKFIGTYCVKVSVWDPSYKLAEYIKPKISPY